jgi:hypothetical protein
MSQSIDITHQTFGRLTAIGRAPNKGRRTVWVCKCDCGNTISVDTSALRSGNTKSCGCLQKERVAKINFIDLTGRCFYRWTVIKYFGNKKWLCQCECGTKKEVLGASLVHGTSKSCGCFQKEKMAQRTLPNAESSFNKLFAMYKNKACKKGRNFSLTKSEFKQLVQANCRYCGCEPSQAIKCKGTTKQPFIYNGIDRVDNEKGYSLGNVATCCLKCNYAKRDMSEAEFKKWIKSAFMHLFGAKKSS